MNLSYRALLIAVLFPSSLFAQKSEIWNPFRKMVKAKSVATEMQKRGFPKVRSGLAVAEFDDHSDLRTAHPRRSFGLNSIILKANGKSMNSPKAWEKLVKGLKPGDKVKIDSLVPRPSELGNKKRWTEYPMDWVVKSYEDGFKQRFNFRSSAPKKETVIKHVVLKKRDIQTTPAILSLVRSDDGNFSFRVYFRYVAKQYSFANAVVCQFPGKSIEFKNINFQRGNLSAGYKVEHQTVSDPLVDDFVKQIRTAKSCQLIFKSDSEQKTKTLDLTQAKELIELYDLMK